MIEKFIMAGDTPMHVADSEHGQRCVVLLHGYLESMIVWDEFVDLLKANVRVVTLDLPGHGISMINGEVHTMEYLADCVANTMNALGIDRYSVVGHSMGGYVALAMLDKYAQHLESITLLSSTTSADSEEKCDRRRREIELIKAGKKNMLARLVPHAGFAPENAKRLKDYIDDIGELILITEDEGVIAILAGMITRRDRGAQLRDSGIPHLFIFGRHDYYIPNDVAEQMAADDTSAQVLWLEHSGHMGFYEEPEACANAILNLVTQGA
jgi:pimeloyl-ACP methyl ester carboxylesterase